MESTIVDIDESADINNQNEDNCQPETLNSQKKKSQKSRKLNETTKCNQENINSRIPVALRQEFVSFASVSKILKGRLLLENTITESECIEILQSAEAKIKYLKSKVNQSKPYFEPSPAMREEGEEMLLEEIKLLKSMSSEDLNILKSKVIQLLHYSKKEKENYMVLEKKYFAQQQHVETLSTHIEKLMLLLKQEAYAKEKININYNIQIRQSESLRKSVQHHMKYINAKDKLISELREGSKILEDQLRLMDERFLTIKSKLAFVQEKQSKEVQKLKKEAMDLRVKYHQQFRGASLDDVIINNHSQNDTNKNNNHHHHLKEHLSPNTTLNTTNRGVASQNQFLILDGDDRMATFRRSGSSRLNSSGPLPLTARLQHQASQRSMLPATPTKTAMNTNDSAPTPAPKRPSSASAASVSSVTKPPRAPTPQEKIIMERAITKLRRMQGKSSIAEWTPEKARELAFSKDPFGM